MSKKEVWRSVRGYEGLYEVSNFGRVKSLNYMRSGKEGIMKPAPNKKGYYYVNLLNCWDSVAVHILVWEAFNEEIPKGMEIDHIDGNPGNNRLENLRCVTHKENCNNPVTIKRYIESNRYKGKGKPVEQYTLDGQFVKLWPSRSEAARAMGVHNSAISACCRNKCKTVYGFIWRNPKDAV